MGELKRFEGKCVVVTGASRGIGEGIALRFAREGAEVLVGANEDRVNEVAERIRAFGGSALAVYCDVTDKKSVQELFDRAVGKFGKVDISVQNAGVITISRIEEMTEEEWDRVLAVNTKGVFLCCQAAARIMIKQKSGRLINTASGQARDGFIYTPHYAAGLVAFLASEDAAYITGQTINVDGGLIMS